MFFQISISNCFTSLHRSELFFIDNRYLFLADKDPVNAYCWIYSTFTVSRHLKGIPGRGVASAGVGQALPDDEARHHRYYQWVS